ncbi:MAG: hypothetical protein ACFFFT_04385 [Candidatus Thorarchaeota archaeon]
MKKTRSTIRVFIIIITLISPFYLNLNKNHQNFCFKEDKARIEEFDTLRVSDIAGTDLYAEQIRAYVAGNKSIIKQSLFTNDTNIFTQFDMNDPAFYKCNVLISASNTINPGISPIPLTESLIPNQFGSGFNRFVGFLYYDKEVSANDANSRAERALEIIKRKFQIDLIRVDTEKSNFFPFVGDYPDWKILLNELTTNLPMDGYWRALDLSRLTSKIYLNNHHFSTTFIILNSLDFFEGDYEITTTQLDFNINTLDLSFFEQLETKELVDQLNNIIENYGEIINTTISAEELEQFIEFLGSFALLNDSHYTNLVIQYEGLSEGIIKTGANQYKFDLWKAMGYEDEPLAPSEKIYIAFIGALLTDIEINILCTEIIDSTQVNFEFYDYLLEQIGLILYLTGIEFDVQALEEYSFELFWVNEEGFKRSFVKPVNLYEPSDIVNLFQQLGFKGFPFIPTGIVNPIENFIVTYNISNSEPNLILKKELIGENASFGAFRDFSYNISAENVGIDTAWGIATPISLDLNDFLLLLTFGSQTLADQIKNTIWDVVRIEYPYQYDSLEDFFNFDKDPRIFYFDSLGTGIYDSFFPNFLNFSNLWPFNDAMDHVIDVIEIGYPQLINTLAILGWTTDEIKDLFTNKYSIWNDENWRLEPGELITYNVQNISIINIDSFSPFYINNFTVDTDPQTPELIYGSSINGTIPEMAYTNDNESWIIQSEEIFLQQRIEADFIFRNDTYIDFNEFNLERVSIIINFSASDNLDDLIFEIYNFNDEIFQDMNPYLDSIENNSWTFSFTNNNNSLDWLFYPLEMENHTMLFKIGGINSEDFTISINDLDMEFSTRDININEDTGSRVIFGSVTGNIQFESRSNSIPLSTYNMASIIATSQVNNYSVREGDISMYILNLKNIGSDVAENISISLDIPGIIKNTGDFFLEKGNLTLTISKLDPNEEKMLNFSFYVPNTRLISKVSIIYYNPKNVQGGNSSKIVSLTNEVYLSAPLDFAEKFPYVRLLKIFSFMNDIDPDSSIFNLTYFLISINPLEINTPDLNISIIEQIGDLKRIDSSELYFENISFFEIITFNITLNKVGWKSYYYPPINFIDSSEDKTIQILRSSSCILGVIDFTLTKYVNKEQIKVGDEITVFIDVKNIGTITVGDIVVNDEISFSQSEFSLINGKLVNFITNLEPGEVITINYTIRAKKQGYVNLNPAYINFYYLHQLVEVSNIVLIKIIKSQFDQLLYVLIPGVVGIFILLTYFLEISRYNKKKDKLRRTEKSLLEMSSRESILNVESTLKGQLKTLSKIVKEKSEE